VAFFSCPHPLKGCLNYWSDSFYNFFNSLKYHIVALLPFRGWGKKFFVNLKRLGIFAIHHFNMFAVNLFNGIKKTTVIIIVVLVIIIPVANGVGFNM